ncbi:kinase-like protein [Mycena alexandri]|uniref:Kinase-like protein n=1 Tax=Mycena alexandri TaxID=1745969 RepID=A0AAD6T049_9AGAR|nr:kinase-like protein [Mycena alexandri]
MIKTRLLDVGGKKLLVSMHLLLRATFSRGRFHSNSFSCHRPSFQRRTYSDTPQSHSRGDAAADSAAPITPVVQNVELTFVEEPLGLLADQGYGYLQVDFGQRLGPSGRYEILRKLGWGMNASVWLARDHVNARYVAVKALKGMSTDLHFQGYIQELPIMERVTQLIRRSGHPVYCTPLLSHFIHPGKPNDGQHLCLVMDVLAADVETLGNAYTALPPQLVKLILRDSLRGLAQLHASGCVHTDLKASNIMCNVPDLTTEDNLRATIEMTPARRHPPQQSWDPVVEAAVSQPLPLPTLEQASSGSFMLADFGSAQIIADQVTSHITPETLRAPEVIMRRPWDSKVDIWTFGCLVYEFLLGVPLFSRECATDPADPDQHHLAQMRALTGDELALNFELPPHILGSLSATHFSLLFREKALALGLSEHDVAGAVDVMSRCLRIDPTARPTAIQLARESPWLLELGDDF